MKRSAMKRKPPPRRACPVCGNEFVPRLGQKTCSRSCSGKLVGRSHRSGGRPPGPKVRLVCPRCGATFETWPSQASGRKYCSATCQARARQRTPDGYSLAQWKAAKGRRCESCGTRRGPFHLHHCIYRQEVRRRKGDQFDPANGMTLCLHCHSGQHSRKRPIPLTRVPTAAVAYAVRLMGEDAARTYLARRYAAEPTTQEVRSVAA